MTSALGSLVTMAVGEISVAELAALGDDVRLVDVREVDEFAAGHAPDARNVPMSVVVEHLDEFRDGPVYVICRSGARSMRVCEFVESQGLEARNVTGGMLAWADAGHEVITGT